MTMAKTNRGFLLLIFGFVLCAIAFVVYIILYSDLQLWIMRINPIDDSRLSRFYNKSKGNHVLRHHHKDKASVPLAQEQELKRELDIRLKAAAMDKKIILFWAPAFGSKSPVLSPNSSQCGNCEITYDRLVMNNSQTGAILYHFDTIKAWDMPKSRNPNHLHIFWTMESTANLKQHHFALKTEDEFGMNATMTYRRDSDFLTTYGGGKSFDSLMGNDVSIYENIMKSKSKLAIIVISDCDLTFGAIIRLALIKQLKKAGLRIDTYGRCFSKWIEKDVLEKTANQYKFYFSYENSYHCRDYMTEKFFVNALTHDTVPVVWGATKQDYEAIAPSGSFIFAEDFESPKHLIEHLEFLDHNDEEYFKFFRWRTMKPTIVPKRERESGFCAICRALHGINVDDRFNPKYNRSSIPLFTNGIAKRLVPSLRKYMYEDENPECFNVQQA